MSLSLDDHQVTQLAERRFEQRLIGILAESDPAAGRELSTSEGRRTLRTQCARARRHGLTSELDMACYVITAWLLGTDFDTRLPAMAEILADERLTASGKAEAIERTCTAVLAELRES